MEKEGRPGGRQELVRRMAGIEGIYVPAFYEPKYGRDGRFLSLEPLCGEAAFPVKKRRLADVESVPVDDRPLLPNVETVHDRAVLELFRGCSRGCRFCQAGMIYRPVREKSVDRLMEVAENMIRNTGYQEIS